jgi:hypothetical protein
MKIIQLLFVMSIFNVYCQNISLPAGYTTVEIEDRGMIREHHKAFFTVDDAIRNHKMALHMNGMDTSKTRVDLKYSDTPLFSFFYKKGNYESVFITMVTKGVIGYESVFVECYIEEIEFFISDGYMLMFDPRQNKRKHHEY